MPTRTKKWRVINKDVACIIEVRRPENQQHFGIKIHHHSRPMIASSELAEPAPIVPTPGPGVAYARKQIVWTNSESLWSLRDLLSEAITGRVV